MRPAAGEHKRMRAVTRPARRIAGAASAALLLAAAPAAEPAAPGDVASTAEPELQTVVVTARKRSESLAEVPASITAFTSEALEDYHISSFGDYATKTPNLSFSYGGGPTGIADARTVAIRGITGQNLFGTSGATGFYIDDTPLPGSIDPRIVDIDNIEVLKGPQGTLYGESSLGGNVRLLTRAPDLDTFTLSYSADAGATDQGGSADGGASLVGNAALIDGTLALRAVAFADHEAGYLTRTYPDPASPAVTDPFLVVPRHSSGDQGAVTTYGGSLTGLWRVTERFDLRLRLLHQQQMDRGFPASFAPLPQFDTLDTLDRAFNVQPHAQDSWTLPTIDLTYRGSAWSIVSSTSYFYRHTLDVEDSTYGTQQIFSSYYQVAGLPPQPYLWVGEHYHREIASETRWSFEPIHGWSGTLGLFFSNTRTRFDIPPTFASGLVAATAHNTVVGPWPDDLIWTQDNPGTQKDFSLFGELYYKLVGRLTLTLGARQYWLRQHTDYTADGFMNFGATPSDPQSNAQTGTNPKLALAYQASDATLYYVSASKGFRAGGAQPFAPFCTLPTLPIDAITHLRSDTLWSYEGGAKIQLSEPALLLSAAAFHIDWDRLQQQVGLPCGLYTDINGGKASINGVELEALGHLTHALQVRLGLGYEHTGISDPGALANVGVRAGSRISGVPDWTATLGAVYRRALIGETTGFVSADYGFTGSSISLLVGGAGTTATRASYGLANLRFGIEWGRSQLALNLHNLTNARPNLGDIGYVGYAQYSASGSVIPQVATLQPLTVTLEFRQTL